MKGIGGEANSIRGSARNGSDGTELELKKPPPTSQTQKLAMAASHRVDDMSHKIQDRWNTKNLGLRVASDFVSAASAAASVAPVISIIDK